MSVPTYERFFRAHYKFITKPDKDTLFIFLEAIHSLNDIIDKDSNFIKNDAFLSLKTIRNRSHHKEELLNEFKISPIFDIPNISSDLMYVCLISSEFVEKSINEIFPKYRSVTESIVRSTFDWYGSVVDIYPTLFNFAVSVFENIKKQDLEINCDEYLLFEDTYNEETACNRSHIVSGKIRCGANDTGIVIRTIEDSFKYLNEK